VKPGETLIRLGEGAALAVSGTPLDVNPPPAANGLNTVTRRVDGVAMSEPKIVAVSFSPLTKTVGRLLPLICTTEFVRKPLPVTVKVKFRPPDATEGGLMLAITGAVCARPAWHVATKKTIDKNRKTLDLRRA
jgi:hypothetical protein